MKRVVKRTGMVAVMLALAWACAGVTIQQDENGITFEGPDEKIIHAKGLEDAKAKIFDHLVDLQGQDPPNQTWIDDWKATYDGIIQTKKESQRTGGAGTEEGNAGKAP